jgi:hypothetical protein
MVRIKARYKLQGWNANQLKLRVANILTAYGKVLGQHFKDEISLPQFPWPNPTRRRNGSVVFSPRNIVDTGAFLGSQQRERPSATQLRFTWGGGGVDYAGRILTGEGARWGKDGPPRNWIKLALDKQPLDRFFAEEWGRLSRTGL